MILTKKYVIKQKKNVLCLCGTVLALFMFSACSTFSLGARAYYSPPQEPVSFSPPKPARVVLENGMIVYLLEDHEVPLITIRALVRTGSVYEPADRVGVASITGKLVRTGGTKNYSPEQLDEVLEQNSILFSAGSGMTSASVSINFLVEHTDLAFEIFSEALRMPVFDKKQLELTINKIKERIKRKNDNPISVANREFRKILFGPDSPYAREVTERTLNNISRDDLIAFHRKYYKPNNIMLGVVGDFKQDEIMDRIEKYFGDWEPEEVNFPEFPKVVDEVGKSVNFIAKDSTQSFIRVGQLSIKRDNPDFFAFSIMNDMLGGQSFTSRLFRELRAEKGLVYAVGTSFSPGDLDVGSFMAFAETRTASTFDTISAIVDNFNKMREEYVSDEELTLAKDMYLNSYIFSFSSRYKILTTQISLEYFGLPQDFMERYRENVEKVTKEAIRRVARKYLDPGKLKVLLIGNHKLLEENHAMLEGANIIELE